MNEEVILEGLKERTLILTISSVWPEDLGFELLEPFIQVDQSREGLKELGILVAEREKEHAQEEIEHQ